METAATVLLVFILLAAVVGFVVMGMRQHRRSQALARKAHTLNMHFSVEDLYATPIRYARFRLLSSGHSPRAHNVTYGRLGGLAVRGFDFYDERGHGPRREARRRSIVVVETDFQMPSVILWNSQSQAAAPGVWRPDGQMGCWAYQGSASFAAMLAEACGPLAERGVSVESAGTTLMLSGMPSRHGGQYILDRDEVLEVIEAIRQFRPPPEVPCGPEAGDLLNLDVETPGQS